jgi:hypothetical protein
VPTDKTDWARNAQNPSFDLRLRQLGRRKVGVERRDRALVLVGVGKPGSDAEGVVLIARAVVGGEAAEAALG